MTQHPSEPALTAATAPPPPQGLARRRALGMALLLWGLTGLPAHGATPLADQPLAANAAVPGNLALALSVEYPTAVSVAHPDGSYNSASTYLGYFDPNKCYAYKFVDVESSSAVTHFAPAGLARTATVGGVVTSLHTCTGVYEHLWSGNYLNWATMQTVDPFRWSLTGGYRVVDTPGTATSPSVTVIAKAWASGQGGVGNFPDRVVTSATDIANATPFTANGTLTAYVQGRGQQVNFVQSGAYGTGGMLGTYFNGTNLDYDALPAAPVLTRTERVNFDWGVGSPLAGVVNSDNFSARWVSTDTVPTTGTYTFQTNGDDGVRLWVNGTLLIDDWTTHPPTVRTATINLTAGVPLNVRLEYFEAGGGAAMQFSWKRPGDLSFSTFDANGGFWYAPVRVKVCDASAPGSPNGLESNCKAYTYGHKPEGLMQRYADRIRYSVFGYLNDSNLQRDAGVLRAQQKFIGPTYTLPGQVPTTNAAAEWDAATGVFIQNPDGITSAMGVTIANSGAINYLNKFGEITRGGYKTFDPVGELFYATLRYYKNLGNVPAWSDPGAADTATRATWADGFPVITAWNDPILYSCQKSFVLGIGDVNTHADKNVPGPTGTANEPTKPSTVTNDPTYSVTVNAVTTTNQVGVLQGLGASLGSMENYNGCCSNNTALMAGLAYDANIRDVRPDDASQPQTLGTQTVQTYWIDVLEYQTFKPNNQFYLAAKYGGFKVPEGYTAGTALQDAWWRTTTDDVFTQPRPDNYYVAGRPDQMVDGLSKAFQSIASQVTAAAVSNVVPQPQVASGGGNVSYSATWNAANWTGEVAANELTYDGTTGAPVLNNRWLLSTKLAAQLAGTGWDTGRRVISWNTTTRQGVPFRLASLDTAQQNALSTPYTAGDTLTDYLNYLRGDRSNEGKLRVRAGLLGDIVGGKPVAVGPPNLPLSNASNPGYSAFKAAQASRQTVLYFGANDGMLHAVNGNLTGAGAGQELFAYVPGVLFQGPTGTPATNGLVALGNPGYVHRAYVDSAPNVFDINMGQTAGSATGTAWKSVLMGGLGKGGKAYYAIDVTDPVGMVAGADNAAAELNAASKMMWEFTDSRLGYTYGQPIVVKTRQHGWVALLPSGYNNADGQGYLFIVNPRTGALIQALATGAGSPGNDAGLAQVNAFVLNRTDGTADAAYAGDLLGNVWRFDLTATGDYPAPVKIAALTDANGNPQPVTTRPLIEVHPTTRRRVVLIGTGRLLDQSDASSSQNQSFYAIVDGTNAQFNANSSASSTPRLPAGISFPITRSKLVANTDPVAVVTVDNVTKVGWYIDLGSGWRSVSDSAPFFGKVSFASTLPNSSACSTASSTRLYSVDFDNGKSELLSGATAVAYINAESGITDIQNLSASGQRQLTLGLDNKKIVRVNTAPLAPLPLRRINWREIPVAN